MQNPIHRDLKTNWRPSGNHWSQGKNVYSLTGCRWLLTITKKLLLKPYLCRTRPHGNHLLLGKMCIPLTFGKCSLKAVDSHEH